MTTPTISRTKISCGLRQLSHVWAFERDLDIFRTWLKNRASRGRLLSNFVNVFSDAEAAGNGAWLAGIIRRHKLGTVKKVLNSHLNPNTLRDISVWIWIWNGELLPDKKKK